MVSPQSITLRIMHTDDLAAVCAIEKQVQYAPWSEKLFAEGLERHRCMVAINQQQQIVGFSIVQFIVDEAHLLNIAVEPTQQKQGIGKVLLDDVLVNSQQKKASTIFLEVRESNQRAIQLYQVAGFNEIGLRKNYYPTANGKENAVIMALMIF
ncbi:MAG TPA: ribosomal protein S18-alanine N-acetyltransferase [Agitococcus sp.]|nr:ribosomal protein S18-alanine N-acetyltransferase [Agitococcus sp.]HNC86913.1 ribosomal protein S18-alanine N-acetyltransferase [Agitococcus sp.]HNE91429.1 ribosomal protein S18-alanine N-acetyltransferase [Agitococcus sp.]HNG47632.1 ribosomal protein S18-alanine N-acetyltransferase [Agitococcus sp.]HNL81189.1 ribosomal protein S18-alanine N-acetyltransferase [Agitococcus sp.]